MTNQTPLAKSVAQLPLKPGVYRFYDENDRLLYIGKATKLRQRVQSYFRSSTELSGAKQFMVSMIARIEFTVVDSEPEALLLETTLIKKHKPPYNVVMKDDKSFQYIHITDDAYPRIEIVRTLPLAGRRGRYYGPYTSGYAIKRTLGLLRRLFRYCLQPPITKREEIIYPKRPCLDYHMGRCVGPCANAVTPVEYQAVVNHISAFLEGDYMAIRDQVEHDMTQAAKEQEFEVAARFRDQLQSIDSMMHEQKVVSTRQENADYLSLLRAGGSSGVAAVNQFVVRQGKVIHQEVFMLQHTKDMEDEEVMQAFVDQYYSQTVAKPKLIYKSTESRRGRHRRLLTMGEENAREALEKQKASFEKEETRSQQGLMEIGKALGKKVENLHRVEIYDISNFQGKYSVGSMVVFIDGRPESSQYRKFKIKTVDGPNDFASLREVMNRRVRHLKRDSAAGVKDPWPRPDLIIIDGGKGQLSATSSLLLAANITIPIVSLAKREEELFVPGSAEPICLPKDSEGYYLLQRMRDEAHRFAIGFYRKRHLKGLI
ncbi:MAG: excinuclease ABC subunit C [Candidatus Kerfeldbacteria bacterium CG_4_9_14_3_um_filter_45_8]|nr:MAG: excinuclease ABC subunit C [Candidatus Kerfeldbacteria bacterium CG_4_9_14_3_um_filter_45_8]